MWCRRAESISAPAYHAALVARLLPDNGSNPVREKLTSDRKIADTER
jgi:hypothetical protein